MTHRQFLAWQQWLEDQWNKPDRHDYYQMQTYQGTLRAKGVKPPPLEKCHIPFRFKSSDGSTKPVDTADQEYRAKISKMAQAVWTHRVGGNVRRQTADGNRT